MAATVNYFIELTPSAQAMADRLRNIATYKIPLAIKRGIDVSMPTVIDNIKENRLSGKGPFPPEEHRLGVVTGLLRSSVTPIDTTMQVDESSCTIEGGLQVVGVPYANIHEFGFVGSESVREHSRKYVRIRTTSLRGGSLLKRPKKTTRTGIVRAHSRNMNMPARAPFRTGMQENLVRIKESINVELGHAIENI